MHASPFIRWAGGKTQLLPELLKRMPAQILGHYHEPFVGGGALAFRLAHPRMVLSDINPELINVYQAVRDDPRGVFDSFKDMASRHSEEFYYEIRSIGYRLGTIQWGAARTIYLNRAGFNGLYRVNRKGEYNVPWGKRESVELDVENLMACSKVLKNCGIRVGDFQGVVGAAVPGDFVYFDSPYIPLSPTSSFTSYSGIFGDAEQVQLRDLALRLKERGVGVMLSNSSANRVFELYQDGFKIERIQARRSINSKGAGRGRIDEVIIT